MDRWLPAELSPAGRPLLMAAESLARVQARVGLYHGRIRLSGRFENGAIHLTSHRLLYLPALSDSPAASGGAHNGGSAAALNIGVPNLDESAPAYQLDLGLVCSASLSPGFLRSSAKIELELEWSEPTFWPTTTTPPLSSKAMGGARALPPTPWTCHVCQHVHVDPIAEAPATACVLCGNRRRVTSRPCGSCTYENEDPNVSACIMCGAPLALLPGANGSPHSSSSSSAAAAANDPLIHPYACLRCTVVNAPGTRVCYVCGMVLFRLRTASIKISFRGGGEKGFYSALLDAIREHRWAATAASDQPPRPSSQSDLASGSSSPSSSMLHAPAASPASLVSATPPPAPRSMGLSGIVAQHEKTQSTQREAMSSAFSDLDALMAKAQDMVNLSATIASKLKSLNRPSSTEMTTESSTDALVAEFRGYLLSLGATTAIGVESAALGKRATGDDRDRALARDVAEVLAAVLPSHGGILGMNDLYCMFNRARGISLVSPSDLWTATQQFPALGLPCVARELDSGARVVHTARFADHALFADLDQWLRPPAGQPPWSGQGIDVVTVAQQLGGVSVALARQLMAHAVREGVVVVDQAAERWYFNAFIAS
ncbi:EAP30/Vps36 family-domain-containing protein [Blastocladiella britannica]|nr:EAP30/Vps36 family-domain-containing protein [Blastocladiella britannica]